MNIQVCPTVANNFVSFARSGEGDFMAISDAQVLEILTRTRAACSLPPQLTSVEIVELKNLLSLKVAANG